jgi:folate-binding protein YgfZ
MLARMAVTDRLAADYEAITTACGLLDRSQRGKLSLTGPGAKEFLNGQVTNDVLALEAGTGCYAAFLTHKGKMLGDLRILDTGEELWLDTERIALQELFNVIRRFSIGYDLELHKRTLERALLSLAGPRSREVLAAGGPPEPEHANEPAEIAGVKALMVATDVGVDLVCEAQDSGRLQAELLARGAVAVGEEAVDCLRVERGRPRYGLDVDATTIPQEAGLNERAVSFTKGCYTGQETVARLFYRGKPNRHLRGLRLEAPAATGDAVLLDGKQVGMLGSVAVSPRFGPIALALLRREAAPDDRVVVGEAAVGADVVELPFAG